MLIQFRHRTTFFVLDSGGTGRQLAPGESSPPSDLGASYRRVGGSTRRFRQWPHSAGASVSVAGRPTWRWWLKPRQCTSLQKRRERHAWSRSFQKLLHEQEGRLPTQESRQWNKPSSCGTSSCRTPYPACGRRQTASGSTDCTARGVLARELVPPGCDERTPTGIGEVIRLPPTAGSVGYLGAAMAVRT